MTRDVELDNRIKVILARLSVIAEGKSVSVSAFSGHQHGESQVPEGVQNRVTRTDPSKPPSKDRSLYDHYRWRFARADTDQLRRITLYMAEADLERVQFGRPPLIGQGTGKEVGPERDKRILAWYEGMASLEAAVIESSYGHCTQANVERVRRMDRRDPETGHKLSGWAGWSDEERTKRVRELRRRGLSIGAIALDLGTAKTNVQRLLDRQRRSAA